MRHWAWSVVVVASCLLAAACQQSTALSDEDKAAIQKAHDEYAKAVLGEKADPVGVTKMFYTDTARVMPPGMPAVEGQAAIAQFYTAMGQPKTFKIGQLAIEGQGSTAYVEGRYELSYLMPGVAETIAEKGKIIEVFQKQADGSWKATRDIWNSDTPPPGLFLATSALKADASAELKQLDWFAGRWTFNTEAKAASPFGPAGKSSLAMDCRWFAGGGNLFCAVDGTMPPGYHDLMIYTYDVEAKAYRGFDADNVGMASPFGLAYVKDTWTFTYDVRVNGKPAKMRMTLFDLAKDGCSIKQEMSVSGGPFTLVSEGNAKKLPG